jgi:anti-anti-sigma regulatory factor
LWPVVATVGDMRTFVVGAQIVEDGDRIAVIGELDTANIDALTEVVRAHAGDGPLQLDLSAVSFADFASADRLSALGDHHAGDGVEVRIEPVSAPVARVMSLLDLVAVLRRRHPTTRSDVGPVDAE